MTSRAEPKLDLWSGALWLSVLLSAYLFSSGPVYRLWPDVAPTIYKPLELPARTQTFTNLIRAWLSVWGVRYSPY